jgi:hypothetical protein
MPPNSKNLLNKGGKDIYKRWGDYTKTHQKTAGNRKNKKKKQPKNILRESIIR